MNLPLGRRAVAEAVGTGFLLVAVVGSGIMAERLCGGNVGLTLLANAIATGGALLALISCFAPLSGAHFNPVVSLVLAGEGKLAWRDAGVYVAAQFAGAILGVWLAHLMFAVPVLELSVHVRTGLGQWVGEATATFGLLIVIAGADRHDPRAVPGVVAAYITAAYWFTSSTSFANPAVTVARALTNSFAGIAPADVAPFMAAQAVGGGLAALMRRYWRD
jgi:glycerol uptake facilitator-like aquaporin